MKTAIALRHLAFEDLGLLAPWLEARGYRVRYHDVGVDSLAAPEPGQADLLVVLGGPIGAGDDDRYPYLASEARLVERRLASGRPLLGICLGAQLMARALGARVEPMGHHEIGFAPLTLTAAGNRSPLAAIAGQPVLHWHGDRFDIPAGLESLAGSGSCPNQAFMVGDHALAWQFHLEVDCARIEQWLIGHAVELALAGVDIAGLRADALRHGTGLRAALAGVMDAWFARLSVT